MSGGRDEDPDAGTLSVQLRRQSTRITSPFGSSRGGVTNDVRRVLEQLGSYRACTELPGTELSGDGGFRSLQFKGVAK